MDRKASFASQSTVYSLYIHDDWRVTPKLTLNLGVRYELEGPITERFNRTVRGYDFATASPLDAAAKANYALSPIPELPASQFRLAGGLTFPGVNGQPRTLFNRDVNNFMPRLGFAYSLGSKTVIRGGYGMFYDGLFNNILVNAAASAPNVAGGTIVAGTDAPIIPYGLSLHVELEEYVQAGMTPLQALRTATINAAAALGMGDQLGTIESGKRADLTFLGSDPLLDIRNTRDVRRVMRGGRIYTLSDLTTRQ